ncbi:hypothetical protein YTPLAS18_35270 [Nitrospira sp.]|nr:hypothetical protein YTPLAS18_35270 [Nitrospira sp.]
MALGMTRLVKCVPNFSEGRDSNFVRATIEMVESVADVFVLDHTQDPDHHRAVVTFAGPPEAMEEAAFRAVKLASERIDLRVHQGVHPRVGAADVVPFVPLEGVGMQECVALAHALGARIGRELRIPVFLYEEAASQPARRPLEAIRRGGVAGLAARMAQDPLWQPDFGPDRPHVSAGMTVVGARPILVAFNVNLATRDLAVARSIARSLRMSSGGLPAVKAMGVELTSRAQVQVSMNLVNIEVTPVHVAFEAVRRKAEEAGVAVAQSELIGLIPQRAVLASAQAHLRLEALTADRILEHRLMRIRMERQGWWQRPLSEVLGLFGGTTPTPAGASLAALVGMLTAQLSAKLARIGGDDPAKHTGPGNGTAELMQLTRELCRLAEADAQAYQAVLIQQRAMRSDSDRSRAYDRAVAHATEIPLEMAELLLKLMHQLAHMNHTSKITVLVDLEICRAMARSSLESMLRVVDNNYKYLDNQSLKSDMRSRRDKIESCLEGLKGLC